MPELLAHCFKDSVKLNLIVAETHELLTRFHRNDLLNVQGNVFFLESCHII